MALALRTPDPMQQLADFKRRVKNLSRKSCLGPIGFEFGRTSVRATQVQYGGSRPCLKAAASVPYPIPKDELLHSPGELKSFVRSFLKEHGFHGKKIVTCTPSDRFRTFTIDYPVSDIDNEEQAIIDQVRRRVEEGLNELVIDYLPARGGAGTGKRTALVAIANTREQLEFIEVHRKAGLEVIGLEIGPIAIQRLVRNIARIEQKPNVMVINCGVQRSYITVISGRRLMLDRGVQFGEKHVVEKLANALDMRYAEVLDLIIKYGVDQGQKNRELLNGVISSREIISTIQEVVTPAFYEVVRDIERVASYIHAQLHGADIDQIYLLGSVAQWPGADMYIQQLVNRPVSILNPFESFVTDRGLERAVKKVSIATMAVVTGCALSELR